MRLSGASLFSVACYMATSSVLLLLNKLAIHHLQAPNFILTLQLLTSAGAVWVAGQLGVARVDALSWGKAVAFAPVSLTFVALIFANIKTLQFANVETFIVFRASTPVLISLCEWRFLARELPSGWSWACLLAMVGGAGAYAYTDAAFEVRGYRWVRPTPSTPHPQPAERDAGGVAGGGVVQRVRGGPDLREARGDGGADGVHLGPRPLLQPPRRPAPALRRRPGRRGGDAACALVGGGRRGAPRLVRRGEAPPGRRSPRP